MIKSFKPLLESRPRIIVYIARRLFSWNLNFVGIRASRAAMSPSSLRISNHNLHNHASRAVQRGSAVTLNVFLLVENEFRIQLRVGSIKLCDRWLHYWQCAYIKLQNCMINAIFEAHEQHQIILPIGISQLIIDRS